MAIRELGRFQDRRKRTVIGIIEKDLVREEMGGPPPIMSLYTEGLKEMLIAMDKEQVHKLKDLCEQFIEAVDPMPSRSGKNPISEM